MIVSFHPCFDADIQIVLGSRSPDAGDMDLISRAEAVILPQACPEELMGFCSRSGTRVFPDYRLRFEYPGKIGQSRLFEQFGFPCPETRCWSTVAQFKKSYPGPDQFPHRLPFFVKDDRTHEAEGVFFIKNSSHLRGALEYLQRRERSGFPGFLTQACIPSDGNILRGVIIGRDIHTFWKRPIETGQVITTVSRGARIDHDWHPELQERGRVQVQALAAKTGINLAAVDLVFSLSDQSPQPFFLEINYYFGRRGLGGSERYYQLLFGAIKDWLKKKGLNSDSVRLF